MDLLAPTKNSPVSKFTGSKIAPTIGLLPILRAGLGMTDALLSLVRCIPFNINRDPQSPNAFPLLVPFSIVP